MPGDVDGFDVILRNLDRLHKDLEQKAVRAAEEIAHLLESDAKANHTFTDRTGNLTASIAAGISEITKEFVEVALTAHMEYAVWVETLRSGKYAFLWPTIERNLRNMEAIIARVMGA